LLKVKQLKTAGLASTNNGTIEPRLRYSVNPDFLDADEAALARFFNAILQASSS